MIKTIEYKHNNRLKKITKNVNLHIEILWIMAEKFYNINKKVLDIDIICDNIIRKY